MPRTSASASTSSAALLDARLVLVTGKGGVGRSTVAAAVAAHLAAQGRRVVLAHPADAAPPPVPADGRGGGGSVEVVAVDRRSSLERYLQDTLPGPFAAALRASRVFRLVTAATPGLAELLVIGELHRLAHRGVDHVVFDAPATGHLLAMLDAPARFERAAAVGPIARRAAELRDWVLSPAGTAIVAVSTGDGLAVSELLELAGGLADRLPGSPELVIANRLAPASPTSAEIDTLESLADDSTLGRAAARAIRLAARARSERAHLGRITRALGAPPLHVDERPGHAVAAAIDSLEAAA